VRGISQDLLLYLRGVPFFQQLVHDVFLGEIKPDFALQLSVSTITEVGEAIDIGAISFYAAHRLEIKKKFWN